MLFDENGKRMKGTAWVSKFDDKAVQRIFDYIQGAVYCWCKNCPDEEFSSRKLFGAENSDWTGTPLQYLYDRHVDLKDANPVDSAGIDCGHLLRETLSKDPRAFQRCEIDTGRNYKWLPNGLPSG